LQTIDQSGTPVKTIQELPEVPLHAEWLWIAYTRLSRRRMTTSAGAQPISMSEIEAYARYYDISARSDREALVEVITALDDVFMEHQRKEMKKAREKGRGKGKSGVAKPRR